MKCESEGLDPAIASEYQRCCDQLPEDDPYASSSTLGIYEVLRAHFLIANYFYLEGEGIGGVGPRDLNMLHSALYRQHVGIGVNKKWVDKFDICATLLFGIVMDHPFHDANKRTAFLSSILYLQKNGRTPSVSHREFENFIVEIADHKLGKYSRFRDLKKARDPDPEVKYISHYLKANTRELDKRHYTITFRELKRILNRFDCDIENPQKNFIGVIKEVTVTKTRLFQRTSIRERRKIMEVAFPGWGRQVETNTIAAIRKITNLTHQDGIDSQTFYYGVDTLESLIAFYQDPLRSLAFR